MFQDFRVEMFIINLVKQEFLADRNPVLSHLVAFLPFRFILSLVDETDKRFAKIRPQRRRRVEHRHMDIGFRVRHPRTEPPRVICQEAVMLPVRIL